MGSGLRSASKENRNTLHSPTVRKPDPTYFQMRTFGAVNKGHAHMYEGELIDFTPEYAVAEGLPPQIVGRKNKPRNKPCICGSGLKFKHCHGKPPAPTLVESES